MSDNFYIFKRVLQIGTTKHIYDPGERTPYPIIIEEPSTREILYNMGLPEFMPLIFSIPLGIYLGYRHTFNFPDLPLTRRRAFGGFVFMTSFFGLYMGIKGSFYKLTGFENNGLKWTRPEERVKKYDFTSEFHGFWEDLIRGEELDRP